MRPARTSRPWRRRARRAARGPGPAAAAGAARRGHAAFSEEERDGLSPGSAAHPTGPPRTWAETPREPGGQEAPAPARTAITARSPHVRTAPGRARSTARRPPSPPAARAAGRSLRGRDEQQPQPGPSAEAADAPHQTSDWCEAAVAARAGSGRRLENARHFQAVPLPTTGQRPMCGSARPPRTQHRGPRPPRRGRGRAHQPMAAAPGGEGAGPAGLARTTHALWPPLNASDRFRGPPVPELSRTLMLARG